MAEQSTNRLAFVVNSLPPYRIHFLEKLASDLPEYQIAVMITGGRPNQPWDVPMPEGIAVIEIPRSDTGTIRRPGSAWAAWRVGGRVLAILEAMRPTAVIVHGYNDPAHMRVIRGCHRSSIPVALRGDSNILSEKRKPLLLRTVKRWALRIGFHYVDAFLPVGANGYAYFRHYGAPEERILIVPFEPLYSLFESEPEANELEQFQTDQGLEPSRSKIIYAGRLIPVKRIDLLIEAFAEIAGTRPTWDLIIVGDGPLRASLEASVPNAVRGRVIWTGFLVPEQLHLAYTSSSVFVLPSEAERWGLVLNEAIAAGLAPVVSDAVGAAGDLVPDADAGWIFRSGNRESLAEALSQATEEDSSATRASTAHRRLLAFRESHDLAEQFRLMLEALASLPH